MTLGAKIEDAAQPDNYAITTEQLFLRRKSTTVDLRHSWLKRVATLEEEQQPLRIHNLFFVQLMCVDPFHRTIATANESVKKDPTASSSR